jgi:hypothetical protein
VNDNATMLYRASKHGCAGIMILKLKSCPRTQALKVPRSIRGARDLARRIVKCQESPGLSVAHLNRILKLYRRRLRGRMVPAMSPSSLPPPKPPEAGETDTDAEHPGQPKRGKREKQGRSTRCAYDCGRSELDCLVNGGTSYLTFSLFRLIPGF